MDTTVFWNAVYTRANCEHKVSRLLKKKGIVHFCPENQVLINDFNQNKIIATPLFPSVIFVQAPDEMILPSLVQLDNVINLVYWQQQPVVIPAAEIDLLRSFLETHETVQLAKTDLAATDKVGVKEPAGVHYISTHKMYTIHLPSIGYSLSAKAEPVTSIKLVRKNAPRYKAAESLAFILGFKAGNKF